MTVKSNWNELMLVGAIRRKRWMSMGAVVMVMASSLVSQTAPQTQHANRITQAIDSTRTVTLKGNVRRDLTAERDLGAVEDGLQLRLYLVLQHSPEQQSSLDNLLARQQEPGAPEYHKWLTPLEYGQRFGASQQDISKISDWLESQGMHVNGVMNSAMFIDFSATAAQVRKVFNTQLHYYNIHGGKFAANAQDPMIPAALAPAVSGIHGLSKIPRQSNRTKVHPVTYDAVTHRWKSLDTAGESAPAFHNSGTEYDVTPQDYYTIYNVNKVFATGNLGAGATIAVIEQSDFNYGTVDATTHVAEGGDVATFRTLFGVPGALNMQVYHGYGSVTCNAPGIDPDNIGEEIEAALDAEWANALAPSAKLIFMSCDNVADNGIGTSMMALIDNNLSDVMSLSYGGSELDFIASDYSFQDPLYAQAAAQGQSIIVSSGDSGSDVKDQNVTPTAISGMNVNGFGAPNVTVAGGTDFSDYYDSLHVGLAQSTYWSATNSAKYGDALGYIPETAWNDTCASSLLTANLGYTGAGLCGTAAATDFIVGDVVGGSGGFSRHYAVPSYQSGITGFSGTQRAQPDISSFASNGFSGHALIACDSYANPSDPNAGKAPCTSSGTFWAGGGTSFVAPSLAGVGGLLVSYTGNRQGLLNPALYAMAKAQFTAAATKTACYSNGQTSNTGVTTGLPAAGCIFNDVTTGNNDVPCAKGSLNCYVNAGAPYGMLSLTNASSLTVAYPSLPGYDEVTGIGTVNVYNLITNWNTAFTSSTLLTVSPKTISSGQSTSLTATVAGGTPKGFIGTAPALSGVVNFSAGSTALGSCTLVGNTCSLSVSGTAFQSGVNSISATFSASRNYPSSTSSLATLNVIQASYTVTANASTVTVDAGGTVPITLNLVSTNYVGTVSFAISVTSSNGTASNVLVSSPPPVPFTGSGTGTSGLTITASPSAANHAPANPWKAGGAFIFGVVLLGAPFTFRRKRTLTVLLGTVTLLLAGFMMACGGGSGSSVPPRTATTTTMAATPSTVLLNGTTALTATVVPSTATGSVTFSMGSKTLGQGTISSGTAALTNVTAGLANGFTYGTASKANTVTASYGGDSTYAASSGGGTVTILAPRAYTLTVTPTGTGTVADPSPVSITVLVP